MWLIAATAPPMLSINASSCNAAAFSVAGVVHLGISEARKQNYLHLAEARNFLPVSIAVTRRKALLCRGGNRPRTSFHELACKAVTGMNAMNVILLWLHLMAIAFAGASVFGIPVVGMVMRSASPDARPLLMSVARRLSSLGRGAVLVLIVTGPLLLWANYSGTAGLPVWFHVKMLVVVLLVANVILSGLNGKRMAQGDMAAAARAPKYGIASIVFLSLTVLLAVMAFA